MLLLVTSFIKNHLSPIEHTLPNSVKREQGENKEQGKREGVKKGRF